MAVVFIVISHERLPPPRFLDAIGGRVAQENKAGLITQALPPL
jgi:hypothetical protein